jgi:asparagine synthase (glutamine-hydrolysing)
LRRFYREDLPPVAAACYMDLHTYLPDHILCKVDRASMAHGIEVRVPLLDHRLVEYASSVSPSIIYKNKERKFLMKKAVEKWVPKEILNGRKKGFSIPLNDWMKRGFTKAGKKFVKDGSLISRGILNASKVEQIFNSDNGKLAWLILSAELWARKWMDNDCIAERLSANCKLPN